jgi:hypothetical protein
MIAPMAKNEVSLQPFFRRAGNLSTAETKCAKGNRRRANVRNLRDYSRNCETLKCRVI